MKDNVIIKDLDLSGLDISVMKHVLNDPSNIKT